MQQSPENIVQKHQETGMQRVHGSDLMGHHG